MRNLKYLLLAAALGGWVAFPTASSAGPLTGSFAAQATPPTLSYGLQMVHGWHCRARRGWYHGRMYWHRHRRACYDYDDYNDYGYNTYGYGGYPYAYGGYPYYYPMPFLSFSFSNRHHHNWDW